MADAKKCDRCGEYYEEYEPNALDGLANTLKSIFIPESVAYRMSVVYDLCPVCEKSFEKWWREKK